jgi:hypothetical protein
MKLGEGQWIAEIEVEAHLVVIRFAKPPSSRSVNAKKCCLNSLCQYIELHEKWWANVCLDR